MSHVSSRNDQALTPYTYRDYFGLPVLGTGLKACVASEMESAVGTPMPSGKYLNYYGGVVVTRNVLGIMLELGETRQVLEQPNADKQQCRSSTVISVNLEDEKCSKGLKQPDPGARYAYQVYPFDTPQVAASRAFVPLGHWLLNSLKRRFEETKLPNTLVTGSHTPFTAVPTSTIRFSPTLFNTGTRSVPVNVGAVFSVIPSLERVLVLRRSASISLARIGRLLEYHMDPLSLSVLSIAANLVQFVDFAFRLVSGTCAVMKSGSSLGSDADTLDAIAKNATGLSNALAALPSVASSNTTLQALVGECKTNHKARFRKRSPHSYADDEEL
ncbi:hypothetical protein CIB48_g9007 [Xylaria polymorpha]|nr:hypothetical protein CIB48_g9007 [Xylaria polymorpha]